MSPYCLNCHIFQGLPRATLVPIFQIPRFPSPEHTVSACFTTHLLLNQSHSQAVTEHNELWRAVGPFGMREPLRSFISSCSHRTEQTQAITSCSHTGKRGPRFSYPTRSERKPASFPPITVSEATGCSNVALMVASFVCESDPMS